MKKDAISVMEAKAGTWSLEAFHARTALTVQSSLSAGEKCLLRGGAASFLSKSPLFSLIHLIYDAWRTTTAEADLLRVSEMNYR